MTNLVRIDIEVNDNAARANAAGQQVSEPMRRAAADIDRAFDKTSKQLANSLDKIEQEAWKSGRGMDDAFGTAMTGLRRSLELARQEGAATGKGLRSSLGDSLGEIRKGADRLADSLKPVAQATVPINQAFDKTARLVAAELDRMERDAWLAGDGIDAAFAAGLKSVRDDFERVRDVGRRTGASLESDLGQALRDVKRDMDRLGAEAKETGREIDQALNTAGTEAGGSFGDTFGESLAGGLDFGGMFEGALGKAGMGAGAAAGGAAIGAVFADQVQQGFQHAMVQIDLGASFTASTGSSMATGLRMGRAVGDAWRDGFGESMEDVAASANAALSRGLAETPAELGAITRDIEVVGKVTTASAEEISSAVRAMIKTGLVDSTTEGFDLLVTGAQRGADAGGDMIETFAQSSVTLKQFGLDGQTAMGAFKQSLDAGAPSADTFVGALEELSGNASDAIPVFQKLGLGGRDFANALAGGGPKAAAALDQLLDRVRAIEDPAERSAVMVGLFGEEATAMADAILAVDLDKAASSFNDVAGATDRATAAQQAFNVEWLKRETTGMISDPFTHLFEQFVDVSENTINKADKTGKALDGVGDSFEGAAEDGQEYVATLEEIVTQQEEAANTALTLSDAQIGFQAAIDEAAASVKEHGKNLDLDTEAGRANTTALNDVAAAAWGQITAMQASGATAEEVRGFTQQARDAFVAQATAMGMSAEEANRLADRLGLIPGNYTARVHADTEPARRALRGLNEILIETTRARAIALSAIIKIQTQLGKAHGGIVGVGDVWGAQTGGHRHGSTVINEAGPEMVELPSGSRVATAGATRAMAEAGWFGGGGGVQVVLSMDNGDEVTRAIMKNIRVMVKDEYGGNVASALGQRTGA